MSLLRRPDSAGHHAGGDGGDAGDLGRQFVSRRHRAHPRSKNMTSHIPEEFSARSIDWRPFVIMGNTMPPRDPDEDEEDEDEDEDEDEEEEDPGDEPPVVRASLTKTKQDAFWLFRTVNRGGLLRFIRCAQDFLNRVCGVENRV